MILQSSQQVWMPFIHFQPQKNNYNKTKLSNLNGSFEMVCNHIKALVWQREYIQTINQLWFPQSHITMIILEQSNEWQGKHCYLRFGWMLCYSNTNIFLSIRTPSHHLPCFSPKLLLIMIMITFLALLWKINHIHRFRKKNPDNVLESVIKLAYLFWCDRLKRLDAAIFYLLWILTLYRA